MTALPNCKPWCDDHQTDFGENFCCTRFVIYDDGRQEATPPTPGSKAEQLQALGGLPPEISWVALGASQDEEDAEPLLRFQFYEAGEDPEEKANLYMSLDSLKAFHSSLGVILQGISQPG